MPDFNPSPLPCLSIAAAVIRQKGRYLIGQRPENKPQGGYWEFAGGKLLPEESVVQGLIRECREELRVEVRPLRQLLVTKYRYPDRQVTLYFWETALLGGTPQPLAHQKLAWVLPEQLKDYRFCPANRDILQLLLSQKHN